MLSHMTQLFFYTDLMEKGLGSVAITGNHLIFNCVVSTDKSNDLQLTSMCKASEDAVSSNKISAINRRRLCSSSAFVKDTVIDSSGKRSELEHILCDSDDNQVKTTNSQTKGEHYNHSDTSRERRVRKLPTLFITVCLPL